MKSPVEESTAPTNEAFRAVLGRFVTGVTIVTGLTPDGPVGLTVNAFSSVSLEPPLVAFFPGLSSTSWPAIQEVGRFCINILSASQQAECLAFARSVPGKFDDFRWKPAPSGAPVLDGVLGWIDCRVESVTEAGDHWVVLGAVEALKSESNDQPLVFYQGEFRS